LFPKLDRLEVYLLAADDPIGKRQLRPIFRRKRSKEVLTREQVTAIKRGRRVLRREMKEQGLKRRIDFETTATNLGLYFDRKGLWWPFYLWLIRDHTALKILAITTVLTTMVTVMQPVIEYITEYITQYINRYINRYVNQYLDRDRFTISLSDEMLTMGFELSETPDFQEPQEVLFAVPITQVPCISIASIPYNVDEIPNNTAQNFFTYTFYSRYINKTAERDSIENLSHYATSYTWGLRIHTEGLNTSTNPENTDQEALAASGLKVSDAIWVMVVQDGEVILCAKEEIGADGEVTVPMLPTPETLQTKRVAFFDRSIDYINQGLQKIDPRLNVDNMNRLETVFGTQAEIDTAMTHINKFFEVEGIQNLLRLILRTENWRDHYIEIPSAAEEGRSYYQVKADPFHNTAENVIAERTRTGILPWISGKHEEYHKYTVVIWLEGDDPQCKNALMDGHIGLNFQIKGVGEEYMEEIVMPTIPVQAEE